MPGGRVTPDRWFPPRLRRHPSERCTRKRASPSQLVQPPAGLGLLFTSSSPPTSQRPRDLTPLPAPSPRRRTPHAVGPTPTPPRPRRPPRRGLRSVTDPTPRRRRDSRHGSFQHSVAAPPSLSAPPLPRRRRPLPISARPTPSPPATHRCRGQPPYFVAPSRCLRVRRVAAAPTASSPTLSRIRSTHPGETQKHSQNNTVYTKRESRGCQ